MSERHCPGLPADWLNGWLAAVGATVLVDGMRLRWSDEPVPVAVLDAPEAMSVAAAIEETLPTVADLDASPIARRLAGHSDITLNPDFEQFAERAPMARKAPMGWTLSTFYTDVLIEKAKPKAEKGPFLPGMPGKANTPYDRLVKLTQALDSVDVGASLSGVGERSDQFGLGFDLGRIGSLADKTDHWVDPVVEVMAFAGLSLFPSRGDGHRTVWQRGWAGPRTRLDGFTWPAWRPTLDRHAIDAFLDLFWARPDAAARTGVLGAWGSVPYSGLGSSDPTRGFGAHRIDDVRGGRGT